MIRIFDYFLAQKEFTVTSPGLLFNTEGKNVALRSAVAKNRLRESCGSAFRKERTISVSLIRFCCGKVYSSFIRGFTITPTLSFCLPVQTLARVIHEITMENIRWNIEMSHEKYLCSFDVSQ